MSGKRPSLAENMRAAAAEPPRQPPAPSPAPRPATPTAELQGRPKGFYAATRVGKKKATATLSEEAHLQLRMLAVQHGGVEKLLAEAINDLFRKYGKPPIA